MNRRDEIKQVEREIWDINVEIDCVYRTLKGVIVCKNGSCGWLSPKLGELEFEKYRLEKRLKKLCGQYV